MKKKRLIIIFILVLIVFGLVFLLKGKSVAVETVDLKNRVVEKTVSASGVVTSKMEASLSFQSGGRVSSILVKKGDKVTQGQLLAVQYNLSQSEDLQSYKDSRDIALRNLDFFIQRKEAKIDELGGKTPYEIELRRINELLSKAESEYQSKIASFSNTYINAPFNGVIIDITKEVGESTAIGEEIIKMADLDNLVFEIELQQEDLGLIKPNQEVKISLDAYEDQEFVGTINEVPLYANGDDGDSFLLKVEFLKNDSSKILLGMDGDAFIVLATTQSEVPSLAFDEINFDEDEKPFLYVLNGDLVEKQNIELGLEGDIYTELKTPVDKKIITSPNAAIVLKPGMKVKILSN